MTNTSGSKILFAVLIEVLFLTHDGLVVSMAYAQGVGQGESPFLGITPNWDKQLPRDECFTAMACAGPSVSLHGTAR